MNAEIIIISHITHTHIYIYIYIYICYICVSSAQSVTSPVSLYWMVSYCWIVGFHLHIGWFHIDGLCQIGYHMYVDHVDVGCHIHIHIHCLEIVLELAI